MTAVYVIAAVVIVLLLFVIIIYNSLIRSRNRVDNAWSQIDVQLKRRYDLIPNLVETVKGYAAHERQTLEAVTSARAQAIDAQQRGTVGQQAQAENALTGALKSLFAVAEAYPDLKANQNFLELQSELSDTEEKIAYARQFYNRNVLSYNTSTQTFPTMIIAGMFGFTPEQYFELADTKEREVPKVSFS